MSDLLSFAKYQAAGNDFVIVEDLGDDLAIPPELARALCDRWFGVGGDGVIRVTRSGGAGFSMHLTNADGSPAELSGNGARCLATYLFDRGYLDGEDVDIETRVGVRHVVLDVAGGAVTGGTVSMGTPAFTLAAIPMRGSAWDTFLSQPFDMGEGLIVAASAVSMGNPHLVLFLDADPETLHVEHIGPRLERHELFPERTNVEFAHVAGGDAIEVRVWERGVGETLSCGTGACAVAVAANEAELAPARTTVRFRGGSLTVERRSDGGVLLGGPVAHVFDGMVAVGELDG